ncbi:MAG: DUF2207 domain-containing protein, partial [Bacteroidetes bacterium]|nr:DUF2207 domain-containing protein [Bacteroidota bacterium]
MKLFAKEEILFFHSEIRILENGHLDVVETIQVKAEGFKIKRGIYRVLPTTYKAKFGLDFKVNYQFISILKDGREEDWHTEKVGDEIQLYIGSSELYLPEGIYTYEIHYTSEDQLSYYEDFDELYWNVNGNYWELSIDSLSALVRLPENANLVQYHAYTGAYGASESNYRVDLIDSTDVLFVSTQALAEKEGMTI